MMKRILFIAAVGGILTTACEKKAENISSETNQVQNNVVADDSKMDENQEVAAVDPANAPVLTLEELYDFGDVEANKVATKTISFKNTGSTPLQIKDAKASCGCTVPKYSKEPIAPGETGELEVAFTAPGMNGKQMKSVTLITNTAKGTETFKIAANVVGGKDTSSTTPAQPTNAPVPNFN